MDKIKSAWEIALEKTKNVKADRQSLLEQQYIEQGKKMVSAFLEKPEEDLAKQFAGVDKQHKSLVKQGMLSTLLSNLTLPLTDSAAGRNRAVQQAFLQLFPGSAQAGAIFSQLEQFFGRYKQDREQIREQIKAQYMPKLRAKAEALARQLGTQVELDPFADPEFAALLKRNLAQFDEKYNTVLRQAKDELQRLF